MPNVIEFHEQRNDDDWRASVEDLLKSGNAKFTFQKVDGSIRDMYCTLNPNVIPGSPTEPTSQAKPGILTIYDIEKDGWRSMRYENVIGFKFLGDLTTDMEHPSSFKESE